MWKSTVDIHRKKMKKVSNLTLREIKFFSTGKIVGRSQNSIKKGFSDAFLTVGKVVRKVSSAKFYLDAKKFICQKHLSRDDWN